MPPSTWLTAADVIDTFPLLQNSAEWAACATAIVNGAMAICDGEMYDRGGIDSSQGDFKEILYAACLFAHAGIDGQEMPWKRAWELLERIRARRGSTKQISGCSDQVYGPNDYNRWKAGLSIDDQTEGDSSVVMG